MKINNYPFILFSMYHILTIVIIVLLAAFLPLKVKKNGSEKTQQLVARFLGAFLGSLEIFKLIYFILISGYPWAQNLPLQLCTMGAILSVFMLFNRNFTLYQIAYFWGFGGTLQAIITPSLDYGFPHPEYFIFFAEHGLIIISVIYATFVFQMRPTFQSIKKVFLITNLYALVIYPANLILGTNYLYLRHKPETASIMDFLGPWPWYILSLEGVMIISFLIYYSPFAVSDVIKKWFGDKKKIV